MISLGLTMAAVEDGLSGAGAGHTEAGMLVRRVLLESLDTKYKKSFLAEHFGDRGRLYQTKLPTKRDFVMRKKTVPDVLVQSPEGQFHLVARKGVDGAKQVPARPGRACHVFAVSMLFPLAPTLSQGRALSSRLPRARARPGADPT